MLKADGEPVILAGQGKDTFFLFPTKRTTPEIWELFQTRIISYFDTVGEALSEEMKKNRDDKKK